MQPPWRPRNCAPRLALRRHARELQPDSCTGSVALLHWPGCGRGIMIIDQAGDRGFEQGPVHGDRRQGPVPSP